MKTMYKDYEKDEDKPLSACTPSATAGQTNIHSYPALCKIFKILPKYYSIHLRFYKYGKKATEIKD